MGRNKKNSENLLGHRTELEQKKQEMVEQEMEGLKGDKESILKPPSYLPADAKKEWKRIVPLLKQMNLGILDKANIEGYCISYALYLKASKELAKEPLLITKMVKGVATQIENPLISTQKKYGDEVRKFGSLIGITPNSRYQICTNKVDKTQSNIDEEFGDI